MNAGVKRNPSPERDFEGTVQNSAYGLQKFCTGRFAAFVNSPELPEGRNLDPADDDARVHFLLTGLRDESFRRIEEAASPEGLIREGPGLPLLKRG